MTARTGARPEKNFSHLRQECKKEEKIQENSRKRQDIAGQEYPVANLVHCSNSVAALAMGQASS